MVFTQPEYKCACVFATCTWEEGIILSPCRGHLLFNQWRKVGTSANPLNYRSCLCSRKWSLMVVHQISQSFLRYRNGWEGPHDIETVWRVIHGYVTYRRKIMETGWFPPWTSPWKVWWFLIAGWTVVELSLWPSGQWLARGKEGLAMRRSGCAVVGGFASENLKDEKEKGLGVHVPSLCQNIAWLMCTAIAQLPSAELFLWFLAAYFQELHEF